jgi:hypothetical protein
MEKIMGKLSATQLTVVSANKSRSWGEAFKRLLRTTWREGRSLAQKFPWILAIMTAWELIPDSYQTALINEIEKALGEVFDTGEDLVRYLMRDEGAQHAVIDKINQRSGGPTGALDGLSPAVVAKLPDKGIAVLAERWKRRNGKVDDELAVKSGDSPIDNRIDYEAVKAVQALFGLRGGAAHARYIHSHLRAFIALSSDELEKTILRNGL